MLVPLQLIPQTETFSRLFRLYPSIGASFRLATVFPLLPQILHFAGVVCNLPRMASFLSPKPPEGVSLDALRTLVRLAPGHFQFRLKREGKGFAILFNGRDKRGFFPGFLMAEKSQQMRIFARAETAFGILESLEVPSVTVELGDGKDVYS